MKHLMAILIKFGTVSLALAILYFLFKGRFAIGEIVTISATVTFLAYLIGDLVILPMSNNTIATIADFGLTFVTIFMFNFIFPGVTITFFDALVGASLIAIGEWIFHKYLSGRHLAR